MVGFYVYFYFSASVTKKTVTPGPGFGADASIVPSELRESVGQKGKTVLGASWFAVLLWLFLLLELAASMSG